MYKLSSFLVLAMASLALAAVARYPYEPDRPAEFDNIPGCYISILKAVVPYDTPYFPEGRGCVQFLCSSYDNETQEFSCGALGIAPDCRPVSDLTQKYPDCCPKPQCDVSTTEAPTTQAPTTQAPTTQAPTTQAPTTQAPTTQAPTTSTTPAVPYAYASASAQSGQPAVAQAYDGPIAQAPSNTQPPTTTAQELTTATPASSNNQAPARGPTYAYASGTSQFGSPPVIETYETPCAHATATAS